MTWHGVPIPFDDRDDWLDKRKAGIGGSDVAAILGLSPYGTPFTVWADKVKGVEKPENEAMRFGRLLEDVVISEFERKTGLHVRLRETLIHHPQLEWAMCTLDGVAYESPIDDEDDDDDPLANVQVKTEGKYGRWEEIPPQYRIQTTWEMFCSGLGTTFLPVLHGGRQFELYDFEYDERLAQSILDRVSVFREKYLVDPDAEPPEPTGGGDESKVIAQMWADPTDDEIILSDQMYADAVMLAGLRAQQTRNKKEIERLENRIKVSMQEATVGTYKGAEIVTYRKQSRREVVLPATKFRVLRIKKIEED